MMEPIHDRIPVIVPQEDYAKWLDPANKDINELEQFTRPYDAKLKKAA